MQPNMFNVSTSLPSTRYDSVFLCQQPYLFISKAAMYLSQFQARHTLSHVLHPFDTFLRLRKITGISLLLFRVEKLGAIRISLAAEVWTRGEGFTELRAHLFSIGNPQCWVISRRRRQGV